MGASEKLPYTENVDNIMILTEGPCYFSQPLERECKSIGMFGQKSIEYTHLTSSNNLETGRVHPGKSYSLIQILLTT